MTTDDQPWLERAELIAGEPCIDFINSVSNRTGPDAAEQLGSYSDLLFWLRRCELLPDDEAARLLAHAPGKAEASALRRALAFRDATWRVLWAVAHDETPTDSDATSVSHYLRRLRQQTQVRAASEGFCLTWQGRAHDPERAMWRTAIALETWLLSDELMRLRACAGEHCGWLFVDRSRNGMRRWCSMRDCGNRAKARKHYQRAHRKAQAGNRS